VIESVGHLRNSSSPLVEIKIYVYSEEEVRASAGKS
jgi:hypothetical protein